MSLAELKAEAIRLSPEERLDLAAFLAQLEETDEQTFRRTIDRRMKAMDEGKRVTQEELEAAHALRLKHDAGQ